MAIAVVEKATKYSWRDVKEVGKLVNFKLSENLNLLELPNTVKEFQLLL